MSAVSFTSPAERSADRISSGSPFLPIFLLSLSLPIAAAFATPSPSAPVDLGVPAPVRTSLIFAAASAPAAGDGAFPPPVLSLPLLLLPTASILLARAAACRASFAFLLRWEASSRFNLRRNLRSCRHLTARATAADHQPTARQDRMHSTAKQSDAQGRTEHHTAEFVRFKRGAGLGIGQAREKLDRHNGGRAYTNFRAPRAKQKRSAKPPTTVRYARRALVLEVCGSSTCYV